MDYLSHKMVVFLFFYLIISVSSSDNKNDIAFETADLTLDYQFDNKIVQLQAYRSVDNHKFMDSKDSSKYAQLRWFSIGYPKLVIQSENPVSVFKFNEEGFSIEVSMLTHELKLEFVKLIQQRYNISISSNQIVNLIPDDFKCSLMLYSNNERLLMQGRAKQLTKFPLHVDFETPVYSKERIGLMKRIEESEAVDLNFECEIAKNGKALKVNRLEIKSDQNSELNLVDNLFGNSSLTEVYVTRAQMAALSSDMYTRFNIVEDYEMPEGAFAAAFIEDFLKQTTDATKNFKADTSFSAAIDALSPYNIEGDIQADRIKNEFEKIYTVVKNGDKEQLKLDTELSESKKEKNVHGGGASVKGHSAKVNVEVGASFVRSKDKEWAKSNKTVDDQLKELNAYEQNDIEWERKGSRIVPKNIKVARLLRSKFQNTIELKRVQRHHRDYTFKQDIQLSTYTSYFNFDLKYQELRFKLEQKVQNFKKLQYGNVVAVPTPHLIAAFFDANGRGTGIYNGWFLCDGRNGTPDLRGRVLVGLDSKSKDYNSIGNTGGREFVTLTVDQLPSHTHEDLGHSHKFTGWTSESGSHTHNYKDIFTTQHNDSRLQNINSTATPDNLGKSGSFDYDNVGYEMNRKTRESGAHQHEVFGVAHEAKAKISFVGKSKPIENRQPYFVAAYIMFLPNDGLKF